MNPIRDDVRLLHLGAAAGQLLVYAEPLDFPHETIAKDVSRALRRKDVENATRNGEFVTDRYRLDEFEFVVAGEPSRDRRRLQHDEEIYDAWWHFLAARLAGEDHERAYDTAGTIVVRFWSLSF